MFRRARLRLMSWNVGILALIMGVLGTAVFMLYDSNLYSDVDQALQSDLGDDAARAAFQVFQRGSCIALPAPPSSPMSAQSPTGFASVDCQDRPVYGTPIYPAGLRAALAGKFDKRTIDLGGDHYRVISAGLQRQSVGGQLETGEAIQVWRSVDSQIEERNRLLQVLFGGGIAGLILAGLAALFLAERALGPIRLAFNRQRQFIADASHELRTPLTLIRSSAEMVACSADRLEPEDALLLDDIMDEVDHLSQLVTDLLTLARVDAGQITIKPDLVDVSILAERVNDDVRPLAGDKQIAQSIETDRHAIVMGDELRLRQLILILMDNAIKYTDSGGRVDLSVLRENGHVDLTVSDTGVGIPADAVPHVFERFYRVESARTHESGGTGLGLSIADWIVRAHKGGIHINSEPGKGTRVRVSLPAADAKS